jgi:hypothetical protein
MKKYYSELFKCSVSILLIKCRYLCIVGDAQEIVTAVDHVD